MMVTERKRSWKDAFAAIRLGLSPARLLAGVLGLLVLRVLWLVVAEAGLYGWPWDLLWVAVSVWWLYALLAGVGRSVYQELDEGEGLGLLRTVGFSIRRGISAGLSSVIFLAGGVFFLVLALVGFLLARLPWVGPVLGAVMFFPMLVLVVLGGVALILWLFGLYVVPGSAGVRKSGALDTFLDTLDLFSGRGVFWAFLVTVVVLGFLGTLLQFFYMLMCHVLGWGMGFWPQELGTHWLGQDLGTAINSQGVPLLFPADISRAQEGGVLWVVVFEVARLLGLSYLLGVFAASGVVAYMVGTEDEVVLVEEEVKPAPPPAPKPVEPAPRPAAAPEKAEKAAGEPKADAAGKAPEKPVAAAEAKPKAAEKPAGEPAKKKSARKKAAKKSAKKKRSRKQPE